MGNTNDTNIEGYDENISKDAYESFIYVNQSLEAAQRKMFLDILPRIEDNPNLVISRNSTWSFDEHKSYARQAILDQQLLNRGRTIFIYHTENGGIRFTLPFTTFDKEIKIFNYPNDEYSERILYDLSGVPIHARVGIEHVVYDESDNYMGIPYDDINANDVKRYVSKIDFYPLDSTVEAESIQGNRFSHTGLLNATWDSYVIHFNNNSAYHSTIRFSLANESNIQYDIALIHNESDSVSESRSVMNSLLANYIVPSINTIQSLNTYSYYESMGELTVRILNKSQKDMNVSDEHHIRYMDKAGLIFQDITISPIDSSEVDSSDIFGIYNVINNLQFIGTNINAEIKSKEYTVVWNDGKPGQLYSLEYSDGVGYLYYALQDNKNRYDYRIIYPILGNNYSKQQLIDMITDSFVLDKEKIYTDDVSLYG